MTTMNPAAPIGEHPHDKPVWDAVSTTITQFSGTAQDLLRALEKSGMEGLPQTPREMGIAISRLSNWLERTGWEVRRTFRGSYRLWHLTSPAELARQAAEEAEKTQMMERMRTDH